MTISDEDCAKIEANWDNATRSQKLAVFNNLAERPCHPMQHWREMLMIANYYYDRRP